MGTVSPGRVSTSIKSTTSGWQGNAKATGTFEELVEKTGIGEAMR
jgi:hypothetical protein